MEDRVRAEKPIKNPKKWNESTIDSYVVNQGKAVIEFSDNNEVTVSEAIFELFTSRLEEDDIQGCEAWYRIKGD